MVELGEFERQLANGVKKLKPYQPGKPIETLQRELNLSTVTKLASNENPLGASPNVAQAIKRAASEIYRYPDGNGFKLKEALVAYYEQEIEPANITLGNGSNDVLELIARAFLNPGDHAVYSQHAFAVYALACQAVGAKATVVPAKKWGHDLDGMLKAITPHTKVVFLANPNNPTGTWFDSKAWEAFIANVPNNVLVVLDEAYAEYISEEEYPHGPNYLKRYRNLIVCRTFSKAYGLAGLRVGYSLSSLEIADYLNRVRQPFNVNAIALEAAVAALEDQHFLDRSCELNNHGLEELASELHAMELSFIPSVANFLCVNLHRYAEPIYEKLLQAGVIVRPVANYGMPHFLRVSVGSSKDNMRFIKALRKIL